MGVQICRQGYLGFGLLFGKAARTLNRIFCQRTIEQYMLANLP